MTGYVIYACKCLNVILQLDYEYLLDQHEHDRTSHFVQLANICGWRFKVIKATIVTHYYVTHVNAYLIVYFYIRNLKL